MVGLRPRTDVEAGIKRSSLAGMVGPRPRTDAGIGRASLAGISKVMEYGSNLKYFSLCKGHLINILIYEC